MSIHHPESDYPTPSLSLVPTLPRHSTNVVQSVSDSGINESAKLELQSLVNNLGGDAEKTGLVAPSSEVNDATDGNNVVSKKTINDLPVYILMMVFDILEAGDRWYAFETTCLGLSSSCLYSRVGNKFVDSNQESWIYKLQHHIGTFLGSDYRRRAYENRFLPWEANDVPFLPRSVYGDTFGEEEKVLNERYSDWKHSGGLSAGSRLRPFGKGQDWFTTAFEILYQRAELCYYRNYNRGKPEPSSLHPHHLFAYQRMTFHYEEKYDMFREAA